MKRTLLFFLLLVIPLAAIAEPKEKGIPEEFINKIRSAKAVYVSMIMKNEQRDKNDYALRPSISYFEKEGLLRFFPPLTSDESKKISEYIEKSTAVDINDRLKTCKFEPGMRFEFSVPALNEKITDNVIVLACLNCDVWAVTKNSLSNDLSSKDNVIVYTDARPYRSELLEFRKKKLEDL